MCGPDANRKWVFNKGHEWYHVLGYDCQLTRFLLNQGSRQPARMAGTAACRYRLPPYVEMLLWDQKGRYSSCCIDTLWNFALQSLSQLIFGFKQRRRRHWLCRRISRTCSVSHNLSVRFAHQRPGVQSNRFNRFRAIGTEIQV